VATTDASSGTGAGTTPRRRPMQPDSIPSRAARVLLAETRRLGRGITMVELWTAYVACHGDIKRSDLATALGALRERELAYKVGGRIKRTRYAHADYRVPFGEDDDVAPHIVAVVGDGTRQLDHALSTAEVHARLTARGVTVASVDQLLCRLNSLAHTSAQKTKRAHGSWGGAQLRRIEVETHGGRRSLYWALDGSTVEAPGHPTATTDLLREAVPLAVTALGRPVSRREFLWWTHAMRTSDGVAALAGLPAGDLMAGRRSAAALAGVPLRPLFNNVSGQDRARTWADACLQAVTTPFTSRGVCRTRYVVGAPTALDTAVCLAEDLAVVLRPADELASLERLLELAADAHSSALHSLAEGRRHLLDAVLRRYVPAGEAPDAWYAAAVERAREARTVVDAWMRAAAGAQPLQASEAERRFDSVEQVDGLRRAAERLTAAAGGDRAGADWLALPDTAGERLSDFEQLVAEANALERRTVRHWASLLAPARRVRAPISTVLRSANPDDAHAFVDRVDALVALVTSCRVPTMRAVLRDAELVLGTVLRDPDVLTAALRALTPYDHTARPALVAALGLLGRVPALDVACPEPTNVDDTRAYLAAVGLAVSDAPERERLVDAADRRARGAARTVTDTALMRAEDGARLALVD